MTNEDKAPFPGAHDALAGDVEGLADPSEPVEDDGFDEDSENALEPEEYAEESQIAFANPGDPDPDATGPGGK